MDDPQSAFDFVQEIKENDDFDFVPKGVRENVSKYYTTIYFGLIDNTKQPNIGVARDGTILFSWRFDNYYHEVEFFEDGRIEGFWEADDEGSGIEEFDGATEAANWTQNNLLLGKENLTGTK